MSFEAYNKAKQKIMLYEEEAEFVGLRSNELIAGVQEKLGFTFEGTYLDFLKTWGDGNFGSSEIYGIVADDVENSFVSGGVGLTLKMRKEAGMPYHLFVIYAAGYGPYFCLDFSKPGEVPVVQFMPGMELEFQTYEVIAKDFGDFWLELVEEEIEDLE